MNRNKKINSFVKAMIERKVTLAFAESMTCGLASHMLSTCKGTADMFRGSVVCYHESVKTALFGISRQSIKKYTAESPEITRLLARKLRALITADLHAAITGLASAGGSETKEKPPGTVFFSIYYKNRVYEHRTTFKGTPLQVREKACLALYGFILNVLKISHGNN